MESWSHGGGVSMSLKQHCTNMSQLKTTQATFLASLPVGRGLLKNKQCCLKTMLHFGHSRTQVLRNLIRSFTKSLIEPIIAVHDLNWLTLLLSHVKYMAAVIGGYTEHGYLRKAIDYLR
ncbi:hypothetical protein O6P43_004526 [Quillaja saponaria]|uniref:Uncharacterized protein n=1 Tax=Quillaja saponaria TaxID=32244 RepID=A0AAD7Q414_QUISA|nr:hypothetical protein O6P43_004526 [Quillaja saponaria]